MAGLLGETFHPCTGASGNSDTEETHTPEITPSWARLTAQDDIKIQLPATTSGRTINIEATLQIPQPSWSQIALFQHAAGSSISFQSRRILDR